MGQSDGDLHQIGLCHAIVSTFNVFCFGSSALLPECSVYSMNAYVYELGPTPNWFAGLDKICNSMISQRLQTDWFPRAIL